MAAAFIKLFQVLNIEWENRGERVQKKGHDTQQAVGI